MKAPTPLADPAAPQPITLRCRFCDAPLTHLMADLGMSPLCESYRTAAELHAPETFYPLRAYVCSSCLLVQAEDFEPPETIFTEYAYFSSYSSSWLEHARRYSERVAERFGIGPGSFVVEVASNDGYLLRNFVERGVDVLGIDPARNVAAVAIERGVPTLTEFFGREVGARVAAERRHADLIAANNVLAHVPDINDFVAGFAALLAPGGVATFEIPHLLQLMRQRQFDTIYHEHFSYLSLLAIERVFAAHGLDVFDVEELPSHGGSLRVYACHPGAHAEAPSVAALRAKEEAFGLHDLATYLAFDEAIRDVKHDLLELLIGLRRQGLSVAGYGAPGKGNTLLNYCGVRTDLIAYTVDRNPYKQGKFLPGTHIPIHAPERLAETRPEVIVILPWNLEAEIVAQLAYTRAWGARFVVPIPEPRVLP